jgi:hypothetical protein
VSIDQHGGQFSGKQAKPACDPRQGFNLHPIDIAETNAVNHLQVDTGYRSRINTLI